MKVGIDISQIVYKGTGVGTYTKNLVENLVSIDDNNTYKLFGSSFRQQRELKRYCRPWPIPPTALEIMWNRFHLMPIEMFLGSLDVFHTSDWTEPPVLKAKKVTTIHDLVVYKFPQSSHPKIIAAQKRKLEWVKKETDKIIAVSQATKKDIVEILKIPEGRIEVVYEAANPIFKRKIRKTKPYILGMGNNARKNITRLKTAFESLDLKDIELKIMVGYVSQEELVELYSNAICFVYPSLYEGFGIPILEAFGCGCPVVTSNISSMPEVGGKAAVYCDPQNVNDMAEKIKYIINLSSEKQKAIIDAGFTQASKFSWEKTARETIKVYEEMA